MHIHTYDRYRWALRTRLTLTISGNYQISVTYENEHVHGESSTLLPLPISPYTVRVLPAALDPLATTMRGRGLSVSRAGEIATFELQTRDVFGNEITYVTVDMFKGDAVVNATLLPRQGPAVTAQVFSLRDGRHRGEYTVTQAGTYALTIMINGIPLTSPPLLVEASPSLASAYYSYWSVIYAGILGANCEKSIVRDNVDAISTSTVAPTNPAVLLTYVDAVQDDVAPRPECPDAIAAGQAYLIRTYVRDAVNDSFMLPDAYVPPLHVHFLGRGTRSVRMVRVGRSVTSTAGNDMFEASVLATVAGQ
jgi:hypothetical protein